ncbi:NlpC/P60 family [Legionella beliardensis]|uniref:NlpC/P60 family n=1 Tax=Legionella beliardensis TaxID=91822 RepID=A0A378I0Y0_9GAMM|nr:NlpC/P60 family protein [Legionella beliardensis]STX28809.1 NlpC/P60 family [Legionella beliardensis]
MKKFYFFGVILAVFMTSLTAETVSRLPESISATMLLDFESNPVEVKRAIQMALDLAAQNIGYQYGSAKPEAGGMDCSGTMYYLLTKLGIKSVPRSSEGLYQWVKDKGNFYPITKPSFNDPEFSKLKPGDLLFWSGTYKREHPIYVTHVMMYLGKNKQGEPLMVGASDGRTYKGRQIYGVSVFDFKLPPSTSTSKFLGYSCIPTLTCKK